MPQAHRRAHLNFLFPNVPFIHVTSVILGETQVQGGSRRVIEVTCVSQPFLVARRKSVGLFFFFS